MKYLKLYEESNSVNKINWEMIEDIKDMSLEYLDGGCMLGLYVYGVHLYWLPDRKDKKVLGNGESIYRFYYSHENGFREEWSTKKVKNSNGRAWLHYNNSDKLGQICYVIILYGKYGDSKYGYSMMRNPEISNELIDRIKEAYPNEDIRSS